MVNILLICVLFVWHEESNATLSERHSQTTRPLWLSRLKYICIYAFMLAAYEEYARFVRITCVYMYAIFAVSDASAETTRLIIFPSLYSWEHMRAFVPDLCVHHEHVIVSAALRCLLNESTTEMVNMYDENWHYILYFYQNWDDRSTNMYKM